MSLKHVLLMSATVLIVTKVQSMEERAVPRFAREEADAILERRALERKREAEEQKLDAEYKARLDSHQLACKKHRDDFTAEWKNFSVRKAAFTRAYNAGNFQHACQIAHSIQADARNLSREYQCLGDKVFSPEQQGILRRLENWGKTHYESAWTRFTGTPASPVRRSLSFGDSADDAAVGARCQERHVVLLLERLLLSDDSEPYFQS